MSDPTFARLREALLRARALEGEERRAFVEGLRSEDPELHRELASLLREDLRTPPLVATGALAQGLEAALAPAEPSPPPPPPERIGPYRILGVLGEGGMGVVYRAEQDAPLRREVAVKLMRRGLDTDRVVARFESERQALALMDHPCIARVFDAGADAGGRPYFAMELVQGTPITAYCDERGLTVRERLALFLHVCDAVQHAHQRGVIHRDLKPANVLVTELPGGPLPKVIDFGIAKAIADPGAERSLLTEEGQLLGTPEYMSPEQAGAPGAAVDVRSDVYSLGVVLYELLTGGRPYQLETPLPRDMPRAVLAAEPVRPSARASALAAGSPLASAHGSAERVRRQLAGDLDTILLMALRKEPERRYGSVEQLAADLRRHLAGLPVAARPDTLGYRLSKYVIRHRFGVAAASGIALLVVGFAVATAVQAARLARERDRAVQAEALARDEADRARREAATATEVSRFLAGLFEESNPSESRGEPRTAREILDRGADRVSSELGDQPAIQGRLLGVLGDVYHGLGDHERARALYERSLALRRSLPGDHAAEVAESLSGLGTVLHDLGDYEGSERSFREALSLRRSALGERSEETAVSLNLLAVVLEARGRFADAEPLYREALEIHRALRGPDDPEVAWDLNTLGQAVFRRGDYAEAEAHFLEALGIQRPKLGVVHPDTAATLNNLGGVRIRAGDLRGAEEALREALDAYSKLYGEDHPAVARGRANLGQALRALGRLEEAERLQRQALADQRRLLGDEHPHVASAMAILSSTLLDRGEAAEAEEMARRALTMRRRLLGGEHPAVADALVDLGRALRARGEPREAVRVLREALERTREAHPADHPLVANTQVALAEALLDAGRAAEARPLLEAALELRRRRLDADHWRVARNESLLGACLEAEGRADEARPLLSSGLEGLRRALGPDHPETRKAEARWRPSSASAQR